MCSLMKQWFECHRLVHHFPAGFEDCQIGKNSLSDTIILVRSPGMPEVQVFNLLLWFYWMVMLPTCFLSHRLVLFSTWVRELPFSIELLSIHRCITGQRRSWQEETEYSSLNEMSLSVPTSIKTLWITLTSRIHSSQHGRGIGLMGTQQM